MKGESFLIDLISKKSAVHLFFFFLHTHTYNLKYIYELNRTLQVTLLPCFSEPPHTRPRESRGAGSPPLFFEDPIRGHVVCRSEDQNLMPCVLRKPWTPYKRGHPRARSKCPIRPIRPILRHRLPWAPGLSIPHQSVSGDRETIKQTRIPSIVPHPIACG